VTAERTVDDVKAFLDTSVLVATFYADHEHHQPSIELLSRQNKPTACTATHCLAEVLSVVTGMPGKNRASPDEALLFLRDVRERLTVVALDENEYFEALEGAAASGIIGEAIHDAIIARCALKSKAQTIYTWNSKHFSRLGDHVALRVRVPRSRGDR
jgi:predicted nucleic acid-binding protein